jgi:hypothetical protein
MPHRWYGPTTGWVSQHRTSRLRGGRGRPRSRNSSSGGGSAAVRRWHRRDALTAVTTVDTGWSTPGLPPSAAYVVAQPQHCGGAVVFAGGPADKVVRVLAAVEAVGCEPADVRWIVLGGLSQLWGAAALAAACPGAAIVAHPRVCRHLIDPSHLLASDVALYGADGFCSFSGMPVAAAELAGLPSDRVQSVADDEIWPWPGPVSSSASQWSARFLHCEAHSDDGELCMVMQCSDEQTRPRHDLAFVGNALGVSFPGLSCGAGTSALDRLVLPSCRPAAFSPDGAAATIERLQSMQHIQRMYLTQFGTLEGEDCIHASFRRVRAGLSRYQAIANEGYCLHLEGGELHQHIASQLRQWLVTELRLRDEDELPAELEIEVEMATVALAEMVTHSRIE